MINLLNNTPNHPSKFRTWNWVETYDKSWEHIPSVIKLNLKLQW